MAAVTDGSDRLGRATALRLAREGAHLAICAHRADHLREAAASIAAEAGAGVLAVPADVSRAAACARFIDETAARLGAVDIPVNNAGNEDVDGEGWCRDIDLELTSAVRMCRGVLGHLRARRRRHRQRDDRGGPGELLANVIIGSQG